MILWVRHHGIMKSLAHRRKLMVNVSDMFWLEYTSVTVMPSKLLRAIFKTTETLGGTPVIL